MTAVLEGRVRLDALLTDSFLRDLHAQLYQDVWSWAGLLRKSELKLGVAPGQVAVELRAPMDTIRYRWEHTSDWTAASSALSRMPRRSGSIHSLMGTGGRLAYSLMLYSSRPRTVKRSSSTTGK